MRILIVDEDHNLPYALPPRLRGQGHRVYLHSVFGDLPELISTEGIDLVILDPALIPFNLALDLCRDIRRDSSAMILLVSHLTSPEDRTRGLQAGADDYMGKPCDLEELLARVNTLLRRHPLSIFGQEKGIICLTEEHRLDLAGQRLIGDNTEIQLTDREFRLLAYLVRHESKVLSREALLQAVWGPGYEGATREVDVYVRYLRRKLEPNPSQPRYLLSVWGKGYLFKRPTPDSEEIIGSFQQSLPQPRSNIVGKP